MTPTQVAPGVWAAGTRYVNYYIVDGGADGLTLIDAGLPGYVRKLGTTLDAIGRTPADVRAVLLTHGHVDHAGMAAPLAAAGATVYLHQADADLAADPRRNETDSAQWPYLRWPATWAFLAHCVREGAVKHRGMPALVALTDGAEVDAPGRPRVTHVPGHTAGSCLLELAEHGVVFVGDLLCTVNPANGRSAAPQLQTRGSNANSDEAMRSLDRLAGVTARTVLPGHGGPWGDGVLAAVESARRIGCR
jgi:glyoxylase-like metal-dependent hydrolase (beta-lactamase superfamily II)